MRTFPSCLLWFLLSNYFQSYCNLEYFVSISSLIHSWYIIVSQNHASSLWRSRSTIDLRLKKKKTSDSFQNPWEVYTDTVENAEGALWLTCQTPNILSFSPLGDLRPKLSLLKENSLPRVNKTVGRRLNQYKRNTARCRCLSISPPSDVVWSSNVIKELKVKS